MASPSDYDTPEELCAAINCRTIDTRTGLLALCEQFRDLVIATSGASDGYCTNFVLAPTANPNEYSLNYDDHTGAPQLAGTFTLIEDTNLTCADVRACLGAVTSDGTVNVSGDYETGWILTIAPEISGPNASGEYSVTGGDAFTVEPSTDSGNDITLGTDGRLFVDVPTATPADGDISVTGPSITGVYTAEHTDSDGGNQSDTFNVIPSADVGNDLALGSDGHLFIDTPTSGPADGDIVVSGPDASGNFSISHTDSDSGVQADTLTVDPSTDIDNGISLGTDGKLWSNGADQGYITVDIAPSAAGRYGIDLTRYDGGIISDQFDVIPSTDADNALILGSDGRFYIKASILGITAGDVSGLGDAATKNVSKVASGVAAGDDERFKVSKFYLFDGAGSAPTAGTIIGSELYPEARKLEQWDIISRVDTGGALQSDTATVILEYANYADPVTWTTLATVTITAATKNQATGLTTAIPAKSIVRARLSVAPTTAEVIEVYTQTLAD